MSELNLIKTALFNAASLNEALTRLTELGIAYRACTFTENGYHVTGHDISFCPTQSLRCPLAVCINGNLFDYDDRLSFLAGQCETVEPVPAASPETTGQRPVTCQHCGKSDFDDATGCKSPVVFSPSVGDFICGFIPEQSTVSVDNTCSCLHNCEHPISAGKSRKLYGSLRPKSPYSTKYLFDLGQLRHTLRTERRLRNSQAKGLSS